MIFTLPSLSRNLRNELKKSKKIYFYDNGVRNALLNQWNNVDDRVDKGALFENYLISERQKINSYAESTAKPFFWRTTAQQKIDYVEEDGENYKAFEFKYSANKMPRLTKPFATAYPNHSFECIHHLNYYRFLM